MLTHNRYKLVAPVLLASLAFGLLARDCQACRYTVRDVAFVAFPEEFYSLYIYVDSNSDNWEAALNEANRELLANTNIRARVVDVASERDDMALQYSRQRNIDTYPAAVLVNREGETIAIPLEGGSPEESVTALCKNVGDSTERARLIRMLLEAHSVIVIFEGTDSEQNQIAKTWADETLKLVDQSLPFLPKPIRHGAKVAVIARDQQADESILMWSLGLPSGPLDTCRMVVLMGRGRPVGPGLELPGAERVDLERHLAVVGQDCECGLDRRWMQGEMIPHDWSEELDRVALTELGFDAGSPSVMNEVRSILSRTATGAAAADVDLSLSPMGIQIIELGPPADASPEEPAAQTAESEAATTIDEDESVVAETDDPPANGAPTNEVTASAPASASSTEPEPVADALPENPYGNLWIALGGIVLVFVAGSAWIVMRSTAGR